MILLRTLFIFSIALASAVGQPLTNPYTFTMPDSISIDTTLLVGNFDPAGSHGRVVSKDGHLAFEDGTRFRPVGTTLQLSAVFPDSARAIRLAKRLHALGITCVRLADFDYTFSRTISILADGNSSLENGLDSSQMARFDWFMKQLRDNGIYYVFTFHGVWNPRPGDGIADSTGWAARVPLYFEPNVQAIHRGIIRLLLEHVNPYTSFAYKDDPALAFVIAGEDASLMVYWMYTRDLVRDNQYGGAFNMGLIHHSIIDSMFCAYLKKKGLNTDAKLNAAWKTTPSDVAEKIRNGGFEDPFDPSWTLGVNTTDGAQAIMQYSETDKKEGTQSGKVLIGKLDKQKNASGIYLLQTLSNLKRQHRYQLSMWMKSEASVPSRPVYMLVYNSSYPYNSYGLNQLQTITNQWNQFTYTFVCTATDEISANLLIEMGMDSGDVYIDAVSLKEVGFGGLKPGESLTNNNIKRSTFWDQSISSVRYQDEFEFYMDHYTEMLNNVKKMVEDTLHSSVLLCPSVRIFTDVELHEVSNFDLFVSSDQRTVINSMLSDANASTVYASTQYDLSDKPFVLINSSIQYPRSYQPEMAVTLPAYAGLHDWDGVFFSVFSSNPLIGSIKVDSNSTWEIFDKPFILTMLPQVSNAFRSNDVTPSDKVIQIANDSETVTYPLLHATGVYSLSVYTDSRMPLFRRVEVLPNLTEQESFLPHRDISALANNMLDPTAINAENDQIYWDASRGILRVLTPRYIAITGTLQGQIVSEQGIIVEQTSGNKHTSVVLSSLTEKPIAESEHNMLVIGARGLNQGTVFSADTLGLERWGSGPMQLEGTTVRVTVQAPAFDSCFVVPLGNDAKPKGIRHVATRSPTGRFSIEVSTNADETPWYRVEFSHINTSVTDYGSAGDVILYPNPASGVIHVSADGATLVKIYNIFGDCLLAENIYDESIAAVQTNSLPVGSYFAEITTVKGKSRYPFVIAR